MVLFGTIDSSPRASFVDESVDIIRDLLSGSVQAWEVTEERIEAIQYFVDRAYCTEELESGTNPEDVLQGMLEEARR